MNKIKELRKEVILARIEVRDIKGELAKLDQLFAEPESGEAWAEVWLNKVKDLRAAFKRFEK